MSKRKDTDEWPFMVFAEAVPQAARLADPKTPSEERQKILQDAADSIDAVKNIVDRPINSRRHFDHHKKRQIVMADLRRDKLGKPMRGEPKRLSALHDVPVIRIRKWIEQLRKTPSKGSQAIGDDWRTVYVGEGLRHKARLAALQRHKIKN